MAKKNTTTTPDQNHDEHGHAHGHSHTQPPQHPEIAEDKLIEFSVPWNDVNTAYQAAIKKYQPHVKTDGFRQGKVPLPIVEQMVGQQRLFQEAAEKVLPPAYAKAVKDSGLQPISDPEIHVVSMDMGKDWQFHAHVALKPEVKLGKYQDVVKDAVKKFEEDEKAAEKNKNKKEKELKENKTATTDVKKEETKTPEQIEQERNDRKLNAILAALRDAIKPKISQLLIKQETESQLTQFERQLKAYNIELQSYLNSVGKKIEDIQIDYASRALASWQLEAIIDAIATDQKVEVSEKEIDEAISKGAPDIKQVTATQRAQMQNIMRKQKVFEYLQSIS